MNSANSRQVNRLNRLKQVSEGNVSSPGAALVGRGAMEDCIDEKSNVSKVISHVGWNNTTMTQSVFLSDIYKDQ